MATVSIVVPVYNQEKYLNKCLDSILAQTYKDYKCIIVDDGSTDGSPKICDEYAAGDERITVIHKTNEGANIARRDGFNMVKTEYICFLDSDDYLAPEFLEKTLETILKSEADVCTCGHFQDEDGTIIVNTFDFGNKVLEKDSIEDEYVMPIIGKIYTGGYKNLPGYLWGRLYKTSCISESFFVSERDIYPEDDVFHMFLGFRIKRAVFVSDKLVYYRVNRASLTHTYRKNVWTILKNRHLIVTELFKNSKSSQANERIMASGFFAVYVTLRNAYELNDYKAFKNEIREVLNDNLAKSILKKIPNRILTPRQKVMVFLLNLHFYIGLFYGKKIMFKE